MTQLQSLYKHRPQSFSIDCGCALLLWTECLPVQRLYFRVFSSNNQCIKMCLEHSRCMQHLSSLHLCCLLFLSEIHSLCVSPPGVYDEDSQWMTQVNRLQKLIDRLEQKVTSFLSTFPYALLFLLPSSAFLFSSCYFYPSWPSGLYIALLKLTTNHGE